MPARQLPAEKPVDFEGFGLVFLEAMAQGLPVIGGATGGIPDAVEDGVTGRLVPPDDPAALARVVGELLGDPRQCQRLTDAATRRIEERFLWRTVAAQYLQQMSRTK